MENLPERKEAESVNTIPTTQIGIDMTCAVDLVQPSSLRMVGVNAEIEAALMSQQKKTTVLTISD